MATLPVGEIVDENDPVHSVEENMSCVPLAVAPSNVPKLYEERLLLLRSLHELVQLHLEAGQKTFLQKSGFQSAPLLNIQQSRTGLAVLYHD